MGNLSRDSFSLRLADLQHVELPKDAEGTRTSVLPGDLLFSITAEIGMMGLIPESFPLAYINQHTALIRFNLIQQGRYLPYALLSTFAKHQYASRKHGLKTSFRLDSIEEVIVPLPPISEQKRIVTKIEGLFTIAD
jgi:type I restriction enzyme S subunit